MRVTAVRKGYFGGKIRDAGEVFDLPDALMANDLRPSWVETDTESLAALHPTASPDGSSPRKRGRKPKAAVETPDAPEASGDAGEEEAPSGNGLLDALGGPPPDWLPGKIEA